MAFKGTAPLFILLYFIKAQFTQSAGGAGWLLVWRHESDDWGSDLFANTHRAATCSPQGRKSKTFTTGVSKCWQNRLLADLESRENLKPKPLWYSWVCWIFGLCCQTQNEKEIFGQMGKCGAVGGQTVTLPCFNAALAVRRGKLSCLTWGELMCVASWLGLCGPRVMYRWLSLVGQEGSHSLLSSHNVIAFSHTTEPTDAVQALMLEWHQTSNRKETKIQIMTWMVIHNF